MPAPIPEAIAAVCDGLGHPRRLALVNLLLAAPAQELPLRTIEATARMPTSSLTHHLRELERAGLVTRRRKGLPCHVSLRPAGLRLAAQALATAGPGAAPGA